MAQPRLLPYRLGYAVAALLCFAGQPVPAEQKPQTVLRNEVFRIVDGQSLECDVYLPPAIDRPAEIASANTNSDSSGVTAETIPVVILIHGGGWTLGSKNHMTLIANQIVAAGIGVVSIDYRLAPKYKFPSQIDDVRMAIQWTQSQKERFGFDLERLGLFGYSAGAHLACMIGTLSDEPLVTQQVTSQLPTDHPSLLNPFKPRAIVAGGVPCDFRNLPPDNRIYAFFLGGSNTELPDVYRLASPTAHVSRGDAPIFFYHGTDDSLTSLADARRFYQSHQQLGISSQWLSLERQGHLATFFDGAPRAAAVRFLVERLLTDKPP